MFHTQVEQLYAIPRKAYERPEIVFSPSGVTKCARELFYMHTNAPRDEEPMVPWRERMSRNGTGVHDATQADYLKMEAKLREAGITPRFRFLEAEINGRNEYQVGDVIVRLKGRADGRLGLLDDDGNVVEEIGWEKKTKDKRANLNKIIRTGAPQDEHRKQTVAYALIWGITKWIFEYESLQKPDWNDVDSIKNRDIQHFLIVVERAEAKALLMHLARIVKFIESNTLPPAELEKCGFCPFHGQCAKDGGYQS